MKDLILSAHNLGVKYRQTLAPAIQNITLEIQKGDCLLVTGKIGSGKSTLLRAIAKQFFPGDVESVEGSISTSNEPKVVYQRIKSQILTFRVDEELATSLSFSKVPRKKRLDVVNSFITKHNLNEIRDRDPRTLSSGEQQMLVILSLLIQEPKITLMDEPLALLDSENKALVLKLIRELLSQEYTFVIVDHDPILYRNVASHIIILDEGNIVFTGDYEQGILEYYQGWSDEDYSDVPSSISIQTPWNIDGTIGYDSPVQSLVANIPEKGILFVTGPNGSGKTLLLRTLMSYEKLLLGKVNFPRNSIYLEQDTFTFFWKKRVADEWPNEHELPEWLISKRDISPFLLSEGERKKLAIAICLLAERPIVLDEPSQGMDLHSLHWLCQSLVETSKSRLIVISSNDPNLIRILTPLASTTIEFNQEVNN
ncbi:MAG: ATP-binding cassette domain-containing protein [Candidatus Kariarchaeaceae archaeon]|jgi:energy-coupling factor transport system ATP-binding protein